MTPFRTGDEQIPTPFELAIPEHPTRPPPLTLEVSYGGAQPGLSFSHATLAVPRIRLPAGFQVVFQRLRAAE